MGARDCTRANCAPVIRWAHAHARDVSGAAGVRSHTLFELTA
jgi:hypothetical protein